MLVASAAALVAALATGRYVFATPNRLGPEASESTIGMTGPVGHRFTAFLFGFYPHRPDPVHVRAVRVTGVPEGLRIVGVHGTGGVGGAIHGEPDPKVYDLRPVTDISLREGEREPWRIAVVVEGVKPGVWETSGIDIDWKAGRHKGTTHFKYHIKMTVES